MLYTDEVKDVLLAGIEVTRTAEGSMIQGIGYVTHSGSGLPVSL